MDGFIACANIDHFLGLLKNGDLPPETKAVVVKLLAAELDRLAPDQLQFVESRIAGLADHLGRRGRSGPFDRSEIKRLIGPLEEPLELLEASCNRLRAGLRQTRVI